MFAKTHGLKSTVAALLLSSGSLLHAQIASSSDDHQKLEELLRQYAACIGAADQSMADSIWSHSTDVIFLEPRGTEYGIAEIKGKFIGKTMGATFSKRELLLESPHIHINGDSAWSDMTWTFHATLRNSGKALTTKGRETQVYARENGQWRIVAIHYSALPITENGKGF